MAHEKFKRKLTAILSADVKGYSRLMGADEEATLRTLQEYKEVMASSIQTGKPGTGAWRVVVRVGHQVWPLVTMSNRSLHPGGEDAPLFSVPPALAILSTMVWARRSKKLGVASQKISQKISLTARLVISSISM